MVTYRSSVMVPKGWIQLPLSKLVEKVAHPVAVDPKAQYQEIGIRSHGKGLFDKEPVLGAELGEKRVFWVEPNCLILNIVFAWEQAVGTTEEKDRGKIASHRFPMYKPRVGKADVKYLEYLFKTPYGKHILSAASPGGAGRNKTLGQSEFLNTTVPVPPLDEQKKIVAILSTWDRSIRTTETLIWNCERHKKTLMKMLLEGEVRLKGFGHSASRGRLPDGWKTITLGQLGRCISGLTYSPEDIVEGQDSGLLVLRSSNISNNEIAFEDNVYVGTQVPEESLTRPGDILVSVRNGSKNLIGKNAVIDDLSAGMTHGAFMTLYRSDESYYLRHLFQSEMFVRQVSRNLGATINSINT